MTEACAAGLDRVLTGFSNGLACVCTHDASHKSCQIVENPNAACPRLPAGKRKGRRSAPIRFIPAAHRTLVVRRALHVLS